ncbi:MAG: helix-turn-helix transcriptional regulator [Anaerolineales bacterium]|nr:helix-turn-helix transcriptional regulator [Anaerolineales bacterium]
MSHISKTTFKDWHKEQLKNPEFAIIARELEPGYQIARLRIARGLTQAQLAEMVGTQQPSIARIESGNALPSLLFLERVASVLNARVEVHILPR